MTVLLGLIINKLSCFKPTILWVSTGLKRSIYAEIYLDYVVMRKKDVII